ncbi:MAG: DUF1460 domain-containing protein [Gemmatimonadota bacterium]|jgi:hypothetical protein|nr:DUF1460 domain-containing protein [Gemmatimonadota bacterium]
MRTRIRIVRGGFLALSLAMVASCERSAERVAASADRAMEVAASGTGDRSGPAAPIPPDSGSAIERDRQIFESTILRAQREGLPARPLGERIATLGSWFVGSEYIPGTLEVVPEGLVINLRQFDCVTFVESMLAMARVLGTPEPTFDRFMDEVRTIRYRDGVITGYASRLHYFSDWIHENEKRGIVKNITASLGGIPLTEPTSFMSSHRDLYSALQSPEVFAQVRAQEQALNSISRYWIPKAQIASIAGELQNGDIIAATSATEGLDIAHTGIVIRVDGKPHLMHAPLVGSVVEISERPLADRIQGISGQTGIMVARPTGN